MVEDNVDAATGLGMLLEMLGCEVKLAHDGHSALSAAAKFEPTLVLLDLGLPDANGVDIARQLRQSSPASVRLVALTGRCGPEDRRLVREAGFDGFMVKPATFGELEQLVQQGAQDAAAMHKAAAHGVR